MEYAGANNPLYLISNKTLSEIKADKQPIGRFENRVAFKNNELKLMPGDSVYIFSDGIADQFGLSAEARAKAEAVFNDKNSTKEQINFAKASLIKGKKFKYKRLKELLIKINSDTPEEQKRQVVSAVIDWRGELEQIDDVCIFGVTI